MRIPPLASCLLGLAVTAALVAACLPEKVPAASQAKGLSTFTTPMPHAKHGEPI